MKKAFNSIFFYLFFISSSFGQQDTTLPVWQEVTDSAAFFPRDGATALVFQNKLWLLGGWNPDHNPTRNSEVWNSTDGKDWNLINPQAPWSGRHCSGFLVYKEKIWLIGGDGNVDVWNSPDGIAWNMVIDSAPWGPRYKPYVLVFHDTIWLMGGFDYFYGNYIPYNDVWYSTDGAIWTKAVDSAGWAPRGIIHGKAVFDNKIWLLGGGLYGILPLPYSEVYYNDVWNSPDGIHWTRVLEHAPWIARIHHSVEVFDGKLWVMAGHNKRIILIGNSFLHNDVWYSSDGVNWKELPGTPWKPTHAAAIAVFDSALYIIAGYLKNDVWKLSYPEKYEYHSYNGVLQATVFPNPSNGKIYIDVQTNLKETTTVYFHLYNEDGRLVYKDQVDFIDRKVIEINTTGLSAGLYVIDINTDVNRISKKFIISP